MMSASSNSNRLRDMYSTLSGVSIEMTPKDLKKIDDCLQGRQGLTLQCIMKLCQGQKYEDFYLTAI